MAGLDQHLRNAVMPVFRESVAEHRYGVLVRGTGLHDLQAVVDETLPYGEVRIAAG
ncbi:hypothetical protein NCCP1664_10010 [Zafaria cholistanensis]|uniref:Uncharacterized protein n=1 Tax=Zafaria cholistanensis TaxID=1682741 RepID=A0A5A7NNK6_9MICC|nr:hypothetical protein NCCP1664_10010 [Zafaria cholistanensis]